MRAKEMSLNHISVFPFTPSWEKHVWASRGRCLVSLKQIPKSEMHVFLNVEWYVNSAYDSAKEGLFYVLLSACQQNI